METMKVVMRSRKPKARADTVLPRSALCSFASLAVAFASIHGLRIDEASDALTDRLTHSNIRVYDGLSAGLPLPVPDGDKRRLDDEFARNDFIVDSGFNSHWWDKDFDDNKYQAFACLIDKKAAMHAFELKDIPDIDPTNFHGIPSRIASQPDNVHQLESSQPDNFGQLDNSPQLDNPTTTNPAAHESNPNKSERLALLNQASFKFWANADRNDRATHPDNKVVERWLVDRGFSGTLAEKAATIIRPEWAATGRKPEK